MKYHEKALSDLTFMVLCTFKLQTDMEEFTKHNLYSFSWYNFRKSKQSTICTQVHNFHLCAFNQTRVQPFKRVNQMAQVIKALSLILRTYMGETENLFLQAVIWPPHVLCSMCTHR